MAYFGANACGGWVNADGAGTVSIRDSYNVSSFTDHGTGDYSVEWDADFSNNDYSVHITFGGTSGIPTSKCAHTGNDLSTGQTRFECLSISGNGYRFDNAIACVAAWGDT